MRIPRISRKPRPLCVVRPNARVEELLESVFAEDLVVAAAHGSLNESFALALLHRRDLPAAAIEALRRNSLLVKQRKVLLRIVQHQWTPRRISLPLLRELFTFELMDVAVAPAVAADLKCAAAALLVDKLGTLSLGERISVARRASNRIVSRFLLDPEPSVIDAALQNPHLIEARIVVALHGSQVPPVLLSKLVRHPKWSLRYPIQFTILRRPEATEEVVTQVAAQFQKFQLRDMLGSAPLPEANKAVLRKLLKS